MARRLKREIEKIIDPTHKKHAKVADILNFCKLDVGDNVLEWNILIKGPEGSAYDGFAIKIKLTAPPEYPFKPPELKFGDKVFHPNVDDTNGSVCPDAFGMDSASWGPTLDMAHVLRIVHGALKNPSTDAPINGDAGKMFADNKKAWGAKVQQSLKKCGAVTASSVFSS